MEILMHKELLDSENIPEEQRCYDKKGFHNINLWDEGKMIGFCTYRIEHGLPSMHHFIIDKKKRNMPMARRLMKLFKAIVKEQGFYKAIIQAPCKKEYLNKIISYYFRAKPYTEHKDDNYYLVRL
jgi:hypothetical protein